MEERDAGNQLKEDLFVACCNENPDGTMDDKKKQYVLSSYETFAVLTGSSCHQTLVFKVGGKKIRAETIDMGMCYGGGALTPFDGSLPPSLSDSLRYSEPAREQNRCLWIHLAYAMGMCAYLLGECARHVAEHFLTTGSEPQWRTMTGQDVYAESIIEDLETVSNRAVHIEFRALAYVADFYPANFENFTIACVGLPRTGGSNFVSLTV